MENNKFTPNTITIMVKNVLTSEAEEIKRFKNIQSQSKN